MAAGATADGGDGRSGLDTGMSTGKFLILAALLLYLAWELRLAWRGWAERQRRAAQRRKRARRMGRRTGRWR